MSSIPKIPSLLWSIEVGTLCFGGVFAKGTGRLRYIKKNLIMVQWYTLLPCTEASRGREIVLCSKLLWPWEQPWQSFLPCVLFAYLNLKESINDREFSVNVTSALGQVQCWATTVLLNRAMPQVQCNRSVNLIISATGQDGSAVCQKLIKVSWKNGGRKQQKACSLAGQARSMWHHIICVFNRKCCKKGLWQMSAITTVKLLYVAFYTDQLRDNGLTNNTENTIITP